MHKSAISYCLGLHFQICCRRVARREVQALSSAPTMCNSKHSGLNPPLMRSMWRLISGDNRNRGSGRGKVNTVVAQYCGFGSEPNPKSACFQLLLASSQQLSGCDQQVRVCYNTVELIHLTIFKRKLASVLLHTRTNPRESGLKNCINMS